MVERATRSDARENRERIVTAARAALAETNGAATELKLNLVARAAGVGQGTLYRHFPTRDRLLAEAYRVELDDLIEAAEQLPTTMPPLTALAGWLDQVVDYARVKRGVIAAIEVGAWDEVYAENTGRLDVALDRLLESGRRIGDVRADVNANDVILLLGALSRIPPDAYDEHAPTLVSVIVDGLRRR